MLRGARKQMIVVRTHDSRVFEEAYFVVRRSRNGSAPQPMPDKADMLTEANRLIERSLAAVDSGSGAARSFSPGAGAGTDASAAVGTGGPFPAVRPASRRRRLLTGLVCFLGGLLCGGGTVGLLWLLV